MVTVYVTLEIKPRALSMLCCVVTLSTETRSPATPTFFCCCWSLPYVAQAVLELKIPLSQPPTC